MRKEPSTRIRHGSSESCCKRHTQVPPQAVAGVAGTPATPDRVQRLLPLSKRSIVPGQRNGSLRWDAAVARAPGLLEYQQPRPRFLPSEQKSCS